MHWRAEDTADNSLLSHFMDRGVIASSVVNKLSTHRDFPYALIRRSLRFDGRE